VTTTSGPERHGAAAGSPGASASDPYRRLGAALRDCVRPGAVPSSVLRSSGVLDDVPELRALGQTPQDATWHPEGDVLVHSLLAADIAAERSADAPPQARERIVIASFLHDIGKPDTTRRRDGRLTSHGHAVRGADIIGALLPRAGFDAATTRAIAAIVANHMAHINQPGRPSPRVVRRLIGRLEGGGATLEEWGAVVAADLAGRGSGARADATAAWLEVAATLP
jgi:tRNA nucleotidyltransferase (CCA-adding enzyme)